MSDPSGGGVVGEPDPPRCSVDLDPAWLTEVLVASGVADGTVADLSIEPVGVGVGLVGSLVRVTLRWHGTGPRSLVAKFPTSDEGGRLVARSTGMYRTEVGFYADVADRVPIGHPECHVAHHDPDTDDFVLLLGDLGTGGTVDQVSGMTPDQIAIAVDHLADLHAGFWSDRSLLDVGWLRPLDGPPFPDAVALAFAAGWERVQDLFGDEITPGVRRFGDRYTDVLGDMVARLSAPPWTLSHGDYRADNFFFGADGSFAVCDWQLVDRSRGARDLAYLLTQSTDPGRRVDLDRPMAERYATRLASLGVDDYPIDMVWDDYRLATAFALAYPVIAGGGIGHDDARAIELTRTMLVRSVHAIESLDALAAV